MAEKKFSKRRPTIGEKKTVADLHRKDGYGEYRIFLEDTFEETLQEADRRFDPAPPIGAMGTPSRISNPFARNKEPYRPVELYRGFVAHRE